MDQLLTHCGQSHQHPTNEIIHFVAIPVVMLSLVGWMMALHPGLACAFVAARLVYDARLSLVFLVVMLSLSADI